MDVVDEDGDENEDVDAARVCAHDCYDGDVEVEEEGQVAHAQVVYGECVGEQQGEVGAQVQEEEAHGE